MEIVYGKGVIKAVQKRKLTQEVWQNFKHAFDSLGLTENFNIFDIKKMMDKKRYAYYHLRIGKYRALFHIENHTIFVEEIGPRGGIYK